MKSGNRHIRIMPTQDGFKVTYKGNLIKEGPLHEIRDWMDYKDTQHYCKALRRLRNQRKRKRNRICNFIRRSVLNQNTTLNA